MSHETRLLYEELTATIRQTAYEAHCYFGCGFLEKVYENSLANRLAKKGLRVQQQSAVLVRDEDGTVVSDYVPDLVVNDCVVVEVKAATSLSPEHVAQVFNYLKATGFQVALLLNFGAKRLQVKRYIVDSSRPPWSVSASSASSVVPKSL